MTVRVGETWNSRGGGPLRDSLLCPTGDTTIFVVTPSAAAFGHPTNNVMPAPCLCNLCAKVNGPFQCRWTIGRRRRSACSASAPVRRGRTRACRCIANSFAARLGTDSSQVKYALDIAHEPGVSLPADAYVFTARLMGSVIASKIASASAANAASASQAPRANDPDQAVPRAI